MDRFAAFVEFGDDIGFGKAFKLKNYYRMCDEIAAGIRTRADLTDRVRAGLEAYAKRINNTLVETVDPEYHILVFDIIYCASTYGFFKAHPATAARKDPNAEKRKKIEAEISSLEEPLSALYAERDAMEYPDLVGKQITHITYGNGKVQGQTGDNISVGFSGTVKKMKASVLYSRKLIDIPEGDKAAEMIVKIVDLDKQIAQTELRLTVLRAQLENL